MAICDFKRAPSLLEIGQEIRARWFRVKLLHMPSSRRVCTADFKLRCSQCSQSLYGVSVSSVGAERAGFVIPHGHA